MQENNTNIILFKRILSAFISKLNNRKRKVKINNFATFEKLSSILVADDEKQVLPDLEKDLNFATSGSTRIRVSSIFS